MNLSIDYSDGERGRQRRPCGPQRRSFSKHNLQQRIKSSKMVVQTSGKKQYSNIYIYILSQYSYIFILNIFLFIWRKLKCVAQQLATSTHLLVVYNILKFMHCFCTNSVAVIFNKSSDFFHHWVTSYWRLL